MRRKKRRVEPEKPCKDCNPFCQRYKNNTKEQLIEYLYGKF